MENTILCPAACEVRSVIWFSQAEGNGAAQIYCRLCADYDNTVMSDGSVQDWCRQFKNGRTDVPNEGDQRRKSIMTEDVVHQVDQFVRENRRFTISDLSTTFPKISRSIPHRIMSENFGYHKFCAHLFPKHLTDVHKAQCVNSGNQFALLTPFIKYICASVFKLSIPIPYRTITHHCIAVNSTKLTMNLSCAISLGLQKLNYTSHFTGSGR